MARSMQNILSRNLRQLPIFSGPNGMSAISDATVLFSLASELTGGSKKTARVREEASQALDSSDGWRSGRRSEAQRGSGANFLKCMFLSGEKALLILSGHTYAATVRLLKPMCHNFRRLSVRNPRNSVTNYLFSYETLWRQPHEKMWRATLIRRSCGGCSATCLILKSVGRRTPGRWATRGAWTRLISRFGVNGSTSIAPWIKRAAPSTFS